MSDRGSCFGGFLKGTRGGGLSWSTVPPAEPEFQSFRGSCDLQQQHMELCWQSQMLPRVASGRHFVL